MKRRIFKGMAFYTHGEYWLIPIPSHSCVAVEALQSFPVTNAVRCGSAAYNEPLLVMRMCWEQERDLRTTETFARHIRGVIKKIR